jgi:Spy/CpxP family protein refolding chaperone
VLDRLSLTEEQRASVDQVMQRRNAETEALLQGMYPRLRAQVDSANVEIRALLTPEQQAEFDRLREEMRPPPGGGGRGPRPPRDRDGPPGS